MISTKTNFDLNSFLKKCKESTPLTLSVLSSFLNSTSSINTEDFRSLHYLYPYLSLILSFKADIIHPFESLFFLNEENPFSLKKKNKNKWHPIPLTSPDTYYNILSFREQLIQSPSPEKVFLSIPEVREAFLNSTQAEKYLLEAKRKNLRKHYIRTLLARIKNCEEKILNHLKDIFSPEEIPQSIYTELALLSSARKNLFRLLEKEAVIPYDKKLSDSKNFFRKAKELFYNYYQSLINFHKNKNGEVKNEPD